MAGSRFSIEAVFKAVDRMSNPMRGMNRNTSKFSRALRTDFAKAQRSVDRFSKNFKAKLGRGLRTALLGIGIAAVAGLGMATKEFVDFQQTAVNAAAKFGSTAEEFERIKTAARNFAKVTQFNAVQAAAGLEFFAKAGFTADEAMGSLKTQIDLATVAGQDLQSTMDITSDLLSSLGLASQNSAQKIANLDKLTNSLGLAVNMANVDLNDLFETLKIAGPIATEAGEKMNALIAITAGLGGAGIKGSLAATALKNAYTRLAAPTDKVTAALKQLNLTQADFIDGKGDMKSMVDIMAQIGGASKDLGGAARLAVFSEIFGARAIAGATNLAKSLSQVDLIFQKLESDARISEIADRIRNGLGMQVSILKSGLLELGFQFVETFEKAGTESLSKMIEAVQTFDIKPVANSIKNIFDILVKLLPVVENIAPFIFGIAIALKAYSVGMIAAALATELMGKAIGSTPLGLIILGIGLLIGAVILMVKHWDTVGPILKNVGKAFLTFILAPINLIIDAILGLLLLMAKIPGMGDKLSPAIGSIQAFQDKMNQATFSQGTFSGQDLNTTEGRTEEPVQAPISAPERAAVSTENFRGEMTIKDETGRAEISRNPRSKRFDFNLQQSGRN